MDQGPPWPFAVIVVIFFLGIGGAYLFFADRLCDWQIKMLQSRWNRRASRVVGAILIGVGFLFAWAFATHRLS